MLSSGFTNAPVTQLALLGVIASSIAVSVFDVKYLFCIEVVPHLWTYGQLWRVVVWQICYMNSTEVLQAGMVLYSLRVIERLWGSRKFASFLISTLPYTCVLPPVVLALVVRPLSFNTLNYLPAGPTAILSALLAQYHAAIPSTYKYHIATTTTTSSSSSSPSSFFRFTDKTITYFLALQLSLSQFPHSILPALTGFIVGLAWRAELLPGRAAAWRVPAWIVGDRDDIAPRVSRRRRTGGAADSVDSRRYEGLRTRLEGESRAAAAVAGSGTGSQVDEGAADTQRRRPMAGQILDRFRGAF